MSKSTCHSRLHSSATTPDVDIPMTIENHVELRRPSSINERRTTNVNYVRHVLRKFFGSYNKKYSSNNVFDDISNDPASTTVESCLTPTLIHPCLQFDRHSKFTGELLIDWLMIHFENRTDHLTLIRQVIIQVFTCLIWLGVLQTENNENNEIFRVQNLYSWTTNIDDEPFNVNLSSPTATNDLQTTLGLTADFYCQSTNTGTRTTATTANPTASAILDILKNEYGIHSETPTIETKSISTQVDIERQEKENQTDPLEALLFCNNESCHSFDYDQMPSKVDSQCQSSFSSSPSSATIKSILSNKSRLSMSTSIDPTAKLTSELLLEWLRLNCNPHSNSTQALLQEIQKTLQINNDSPKHEPIVEMPKTCQASNEQIRIDVETVLSDLITEIENQQKPIEIHVYRPNAIQSPSLPEDFLSQQKTAILLIPVLSIDSPEKSCPSPPPPAPLPPPPPPPLPSYFLIEPPTPIVPVQQININSPKTPCALPPPPPPPPPPLPEFFNTSNVPITSTPIPHPPPLPAAFNFDLSTPIMVPGMPPPAPPLPDSNGPPPPPPFPNFGGPPPPPPPFPNFSGPPPPPMMPGFGALPQLPLYLRKKKKYTITEPVKKVQWGKINPYTIKKDSVWVTIEEEKYVSDELFSDLRKNFANKVAPSRQPMVDLVDKSKELRVLDAKAAQNFAIMFSQLKASPSVFREWMLSCDSEYLKYDFLKQLEKYLPTADELKSLSDLKNELNDLQYAEQYFCAIGDIKRLKQRLKTLLFKANYKETVDETTKAMIEIRSACDHVRHSIRFRKMLELILTIGNYMNSSAKSYEPIHGFDISFLPKLHSTKANDGRRSLLHFIVQAIEDKHRDLLAFSDEFFSISDAVSKINLVELQKQPVEINRELKFAREELDLAKSLEESISGDRFATSIETFINRADDDVIRLEQLDRQMTQAYDTLCDFLSIDPKNYSLTDFFTDLKSFCTLFSTCLQEVRAWREQAARALKNSNNQSFIEKRTLDIPDENGVQYRRNMSRIEDLIDKRKSNRGLTPTLTPTKKRSQS